jgi:hypothetical protein
MVGPINRQHWLLVIAAALGCFNVGVVWLIQYSAYPLWSLVGRQDFVNYHSVWLRSTWGVVFLPAVLAAIASALMLRYCPPGVPRWAVWTGFALQLLVQLVTAVWVSPLDRNAVAVAGGLNAPAYEKLIWANWARIALLTGYALLVFWMLIRGFFPQTALTSGRLLLLGTSALGLYAVGNVWLVQLVCYRLWAHVGQTEAYGYHIAWWHSIWVVLFVPAGLLFLGALVLPWVHPPGVVDRFLWLGFVLQVITAAGTAVWWAPLMARLVSPDLGIMSARDYDLLMSTHWIRVALITAYGLLYYCLLIKSTPLDQRSGL